MLFELTIVMNISRTDILN